MSQKLNNNGYKKLIEGTQEGIVIYDAHGVIKYASAGIKKVIGYSSKELIGKKGRTFIHLDEEKKAVELFRSLRDKPGKSIILTQRLKHKKGHYFWTETKLTNFLLDPDVKGIVSSFWNVDKRTLTEKSLWDTQNLLETINRNLSEGIFMGVIGKEFLYANTSFLRMLNYQSFRQLQKVKSQEIIFNKSVRRVVLETLRKKGKIIGIEVVIKKNGGQTFWGRLSASQITFNGEKNCFVGNLTDITEHRQLESLAHSANATLRGVIESTKDEILAIDKEFCYTMFNQAHSRAIRRLSGKQIKLGDNLLDGLPIKLVPFARKEIQRAFKGTEFTTEVSLPLGVIVKVSFTTIRDSKERIVGVALFGEDITKRKVTEAKLKILNKELMQQNIQLADQEHELKVALDQLSERNFELDQLMYKTSHDLRSPLSSILGLVNLAIMDRDSGRSMEYLVKIESSIKKLDDFISSMLAYARVNRGEIQIENIDLSTLISNCINELEYLDSFSLIETKFIITGEDLKFRNDLYRVRIILSNVISNAYKYFNPDVESYLSIKAIVNKRQASIEIADNGIGIKPDHQEKIFDMFFRATDRSQGSGLGMYIVKQAIDRIGGTIEIKSKFKKGTTIYITIPNR